MDLAVALEDGVITDIRRALLDHLVLAMNDYPGDRREMRRVQIHGDHPIPP